MTVAGVRVTIDVVQEIWAELLGVPAVGPSNDCFELDGHLLVAASAVALPGKRREERIARQVRKWLEVAERRVRDC